jgi:hypothetical protein
MKKEIPVWWITQMDNFYEYSELLYLASLYTEKNKELENYGYIGEAIWAEKQGL